MSDDDVKKIEQQPRDAPAHDLKPTSIEEGLIGYDQNPEPIKVVSEDNSDQDNEERVGNVMDNWMWLFRQHSHKNELYGILAFHVFLGQMLKDVKVRIDRNELDGRINFFLVQDSSSGKSAAFKLLNAIGDELDIDVDEKADFSDASAIGGFDYDRRKKLIRDMKQETEDAPDSTEEATERSKETGFLQGEGIITCDEGKQFISSTNDYSKDKVENLQRAMNPLDSGGNVLTRDLKHGQIECESQKSFLVVTYPPPNLQSKVLETGLFQRMLLYVNHIRYQGWKDRFDYRAKNIDSFPNEDDYDEYMDAIVSEFEDIREKYSNHGRIPWSGEDTGPDGDNAKEAAQDIHQKMLDKTKNLKEHVARHLRSYISRYINHAYVLAVHHCAMRRGEIVKEQDVEHAKELVDQVFKKLSQFLSESTNDQEMKTRQDEIWNLIRNNFPNWLNASDDNTKYIKKKKLYQYIRNNDHDLTTPTLDDYLREWESMGRANWEKAKGGQPARVTFHLEGGGKL